MYEFHFIIFFTIVWTKEGLNEQQEAINKKSIGILYKMQWIQNEVTRIKFHLEKHFDIKNKSVLVIGSQLPWIESLLLYLNAGHVTTLEYNPYKTNHPKLTCITPMDFSKLVQANKAPKFDAMITFSSVEHSGLGR